jgi:hypothetical protein
MKLFAAIHVPEKFGSRPAFIGNFDLSSIHSAGDGAAGSDQASFARSQQR